MATETASYDPNSYGRLNISGREAQWLDDLLTRIEANTEREFSAFDRTRAITLRFKLRANLKGY